MTLQKTHSDLEAKAFLRYVPMSPFKVRRVLDQIRGRSYEEVLMILQFMPYRACEPILEVVKSAAANAKHNLGLNKSTLFISEARVDQGPVMKRFRPRAQGRGFPIKKPTCHIIIAVKSKL
uniref:Large ribosomal subunit protein uL22c n=1 Tax=Cymbomonas tetramitiformis TaxID=36881 RepID=A0A166QH15_9CHLO|nr:ribosomal protein L22 [Cymbomonas tetramitiformis]ANA56880.1 ribosomal protein L22 [Cymbomonas tetramitiformis]